MSAAIVDHLKCPVCLDIPPGKVYQCKNGHIFCSDCSSRLKVCPQCRLSLGGERIRNRTLEQILDATQFACPNKELGCGKALARGEITQHLLYCRFEPFYFCKLIGFQNCRHNALRSLHDDSSQDLVLHLKEAHPEIQQSETNGSSIQRLRYRDFLSRGHRLGRGSVALWTPHLVRVDQSLLLILCQISEATRNAAWICLCVTTDTDVNETDGPSVIQYQLRGQGDDESDERSLLTPTMTWKAPVLTFRDIDKPLDKYALRVPLCVLNSFGTRKGDLEISINFGDTLSESKGSEVSVIPELMTFTVTGLTSAVVQPQCPSYRMTTSGGNANGEEEDDDAIVFRNVFCNSCGLRPLTRIRYKCLQCVDFDLCRECMDRGDTHTHHVFARLNSLRHSEIFNFKHRQRLMKGRPSFLL